MQTNSLPKIITKKKRRLGQGHGSGRVKTAGRGTKGQKARSHVPLYFEGGALRLIKRLPFRRGKGKNKAFSQKPVIIKLGALNTLPKGTVVDMELLITKKIVDENDALRYGVKVLGDGELIHQLTIKVPVSNSARSKIEKSGGTIE